ncbi:hypothetical protein KFE25_003547 [Diacronema lutheri]|uniref:Uncharacterized protein n=1 Tax=Diacronema lutheri TaxID=2081491 RepID=A0A8J6C9E5_DIALT|nr:hypothetical protein KFE25_003547 [Diacronema lutheri]
MIAFCGVVLTVLGLNYMKHAGQGEWQPWRMRASRAAPWALAFLSWAFGQGLQVIGLWLAPESVVATVANGSTFINAVVASHLFGEPFSLRPPAHGGLSTWLCGWDLLAVVLLTAGASLVVVSAPSLDVESYTAAEEARLILGRPFGVAVGVSVAAGASAAARIIGERGERESGRLPTSPQLGLAFGALAGVTGALSFTATKLWLLLANSSLAGRTGEAFLHPVGWASLIVAGGTTLGNMVALFSGMATQEALVVIPAYYIVQTVLTAVQELALFSLYPDLLLQPDECVLFLVGIALCVWGVSATGHRTPPADAGARPAQLLDGGDPRWSLESLDELRSGECGAGGPGAAAVAAMAVAATSAQSTTRAESAGASVSREPPKPGAQTSR